MATESSASRAERGAYKSQQHKLVVFFAQSRDQWKAKCRGAKACLKQLKKQVRRGAARQHRSRERMQLLRQEVQRLQTENRRLSAALAAGEKKGR